MHDQIREEIKPLSGQPAADWSWYRARQLEGTLADGPQTGVWPITYQRILHGWGCAHFSKATVDTNSWPQDNPAAWDHLAKDGRTGTYYRLWQASDVVKAQIRGDVSSASFRVTEKWRNPPEGRLDFDQTQDRVLGGHCLPMAPKLYFMPRPKHWRGDDYFIGPNSWGSEWGNRGYFAMPYDFFNQEVYEAWAIDRKSDFPALYGQGIQHIIWAPQGYPDRVYCNYDVVDADSDDRLAWGIGVITRGELHVDELYVKPDVRNRGYGSAIVARFIEEALKLRLPIRFWIPFADVDRAESRETLQRFFSKHALGFEASEFNSAACCGIIGGAANVPQFTLPPKPSFMFVESMSPAVDWKKIQDEYDVSDEFLSRAQNTLDRHDDILRRLA